MAFDKVSLAAPGGDAPLYNNASIWDLENAAEDFSLASTSCNTLNEQLLCESDDDDKESPIRKPKSKTLRSPTNENTARPLYAYLMLAVSLVFYGSVGPLFKSISSGAIIQKISWQCQMLLAEAAALSVLLALWGLIRAPKETIRQLSSMFSLPILVVGCSGALFAGAAITWFIAIDMTTVTHACLLHEVHPLVMLAMGNLLYLVMKCLSCCKKPKHQHHEYVSLEHLESAAKMTKQEESKHSLFEKPTLVQNLCAIVGFCSVLGIALWPSKKQDKDATHGVSISGDLIAFSGAFFMVLYLLTVKWAGTRVNVPALWTVTAQYIPYVAITLVLDILDMKSKGEIVSLDAFKNYMIFYNREAIPSILVSASPAVLGLVLMNVAMKHFPAQVVSICLLSEPIIATLIGVSIGVESIPGIPTFIFGAVLLLSTAIVIAWRS